MKETLLELPLTLTVLTALIAYLHYYLRHPEDFQNPNKKRNDNNY